MRFAVVVVAVVACSCGKTDEPLPTAADRRTIADRACPVVVHPFYFRVEKDGKTSYLLGSRHLGVAWHKFPTSIVDSLPQRHLIVFETPRGEDEGKLPEGLPKARDTLGPATWRHYRELAGPRLSDVVADKSVMLAGVALMTLYDDFGHSLEKELWADADKLHIPSRGLETHEFQIDLLVRLVDARLVRALIDATESRAELRRETVKGLTGYCEGRDSPMFDLTSEQGMVKAGYTKAELDGFAEQLVYSRNRTWIPKLEEMFTEGDVLVVVGAAHLQGDRGVPALLRAKGYTVTRLDG